MIRTGRIIGFLVTLSTVLGAAAVLLMMFQIIFDVFLRNFFSRGVPGTTTLVTNYYMIIVAYVPLALAERMDSHIAVEVVSQLLSKRLRQWLIALTWALSGIVSGMVAWALWGEALKSYSYGSFVIEFNVPIATWPGYFALPLGFGLYSLILIYRLACAAVGVDASEGLNGSAGRGLMGNELIGLGGIGALVLLLLLRIPIGISLILVSFVGIWTISGQRPAWGLLVTVPYDFAAKWTLSSIPMFLLMGFVCFHAGLTRGLFDACRVWLVRLPGGLAVTSIFASSGFAAVTGSSVACAAAMGRIAVPQMIENRYDPALATGSIAAAGTLGALIPPSILLILYGIFVQVPIGPLFIGGLGIGILTAASYVLVIVLRVWFNPELAPRVNDHVPIRERVAYLVSTWPIVTLVLMVLGGMFSGLFTATEAGAIGALLAMIFSAVRGLMTRRVLWQSLVDTLATTGTLFIISVGANLLTRFLALSGTSELIAGTITGLELSGIVLLVLNTAGVDLLWFGIFLVKLLEVGMITPPIGINVFVIKSVVGNLASLSTIFRGVLWFLVADVVVLALVIFFPALVTYLPSLLR